MQVSVARPGFGRLLTKLYYIPSYIPSLNIGQPTDSELRRADNTIVPLELMTTELQVILVVPD